MNIIFDFTDEQLEFIVDTITHNERKSIDIIALLEKIDLNMEKFLKEYNTREKFQKFRNNLNANQRKVFYYIVHSSKVKIPSDFY